MKERQQIDSEDIKRAFSSSPLEPEISHEALIDFVAGRADAFDAEIIESALAYDLPLRETVSILKEELGTVKDPLPSLAAPATARTRSALWPAFAWANAGLAAVAAIGFYVVSSENRRLQSVANASARESALAIKTKQDALRSLEAQSKQMVAEVSRLKSNASRSQQELSNLKTEIRNRQASQKLLARNDPPSGQRLAPGYLRVGSSIAKVLPKGDAVAKALEGELMVANIEPADVAMRGPVDLRLKMSPNGIAVGGPVRLSWSSASAPYRVEVFVKGELAWAGTTDKLSIDPAPLPAGETYTWRVRFNGKSSAWAAFRVLTPQEANELKRIRAGSNPLEKGVAFARLGLVSDARKEFSNLGKTDARLSKMLIEQLDRKIP